MQGRVVHVVGLVHDVHSSFAQQHLSNSKCGYHVIHVGLTVGSNIGPETRLRRTISTYLD